MTIMKTGAAIVGRTAVTVWRVLRALALLSYILIMGAVWPVLILKYVFGKNERKTLVMIHSTTKSIKSAARAL